MSRSRCFVAVLLLLSIGVAADDAGDERGRLATAIRDRIHAIETAHRERLAEATALRDEFAQLDQSIAELRARSERAAAERDAVRLQVEGSGAELATLREETDATWARVGTWTAAAAPVATRLATGIRTGIPFRREARAAALDAAAALLAPDRAPEQQAEGLRGLLAAAGQELQLASTREVRNEVVVVGDNTSKHAYVARFGRVQEVFVAEDGTCAGVASRTAAAPWRILRGAADVTELTGILDSVRRRREPHVLLVPFALEKAP